MTDDSPYFAILYSSERDVLELGMYPRENAEKSKS
jgi:hypothetical protein